MPEPDPSASIRTPSGDTSASGGLPDEAPPFPVPDHTLIRRVGRGAYGEVWLARNTLGTWRAVKFVRRSSFDDDKPFEREFAGIQRFDPISRSHESQLNILHVGRAEDGFYYVMELADDMERGQDIDEASYTPRNLRSELHLRGRLPAAECLRIGLALTTALEHLHKHGLVHRDIKPSNIVFVNGIPKLADIGLVARAEATISFVGTEGFLPPEGPGTRQADIFSLGKVLYEISTGHDRHQFPELPTNIVELPDRADLSELNEVLLKACHRDPKARYQTAAEMHADLALLEIGRSVVRLRGIERRLRFVQRAGAAVTVIAAIAAGLYFWQAHQTDKVRQLAAQNSKLAEENRERLVRLNVANGIRVMDEGDLAGALFWFTEALPLTTNRPSEEAIHRIRIQQTLAPLPRLLNVFAHPAAVNSAEFSPDETRVVTTSSDGMVRIWNTEANEQPLLEFSQPAEKLSAWFIKDDRLIVVRVVAIGEDLTEIQELSVLDANTGALAFPPLTNLTTVAISPDDHRIAAGRENHLVELIDLRTGQTVAELRGHEGPVICAQFSEDATQLITGSADRTARRWSASTGQPLGPPLPHATAVYAVVFNQDASRMATAAFDDSYKSRTAVRTWDGATGEEIGKPFSVRGPSLVLAFDRTGRRLLTGGGEPVANLWDADSHTQIFPPLTMAGKAGCVAFSPDGSQFAIGGDDGLVRFWNLEDGRTGLPLLHHGARTRSVRFNRDGDLVLTASDDGTVKLWGLKIVTSARQYRREDEEVGSVVPSPDGRRLLLGTLKYPERSYALRMLDAATLQDVMDPMPSPGGLLGAFAFDSSGQKWAAGLGSKATYLPSEQSHSAGLWCQEYGLLRHFELPHGCPVREVRFDPGGAWLVSVADDLKVRFWDTANGNLARSFALPTNCYFLALNAGACRAAVARPDGAAVIFDLIEERPVDEPLRHGGLVQAAAFSPDGRYVATVGNNQKCRVWEAQTGRPVTPFFTPGDDLWRVGWSPDSRRVLTGGFSPFVKVWDAATGELALPPMFMSESVQQARFSPDGRFVYAFGAHRMRLWDASTGEELTPFMQHRRLPFTMLLTDSRDIVTSGEAEHLRIQTLQPSHLPARDLSDYARLLIGQRPTQSGVNSVSAGELAESARSLRIRQPSLFRISDEDKRTWHAGQVRVPDNLVRLEAGIFHLEHLTKIAPDDVELRLRLERYLAGRIPPRDPSLPPHLLDLTRAYTEALDMFIWQEFSAIPRGRQRLAGTEFDIRGFIWPWRHAESFDPGPGFARSFAVPVRQKCRQIHFLHATEGPTPEDGTLVGRWVIRYADGTEREWPLRYGVQLRDWWWIKRDALEATEAVIAWRGQSEFPTRRLFKATWSNPQPDLEIAALELRVGRTSQHPIVLAITAE